LRNRCFSNWISVQTDDHVRFRGTKYEKGTNIKCGNHYKCGAHRSKIVGCSCPGEELDGTRIRSNGHSEFQRVAWIRKALSAEAGQPDARHAALRSLPDSDLLQSCSRGGRGHVLRETTSRSLYSSSSIVVCVCVYYCSTHYKAVRVGEGG